VPQRKLSMTTLRFCTISSCIYAGLWSTVSKLKPIDPSKQLLRRTLQFSISLFTKCTCCSVCLTTGSSSATDTATHQKNDLEQSNEFSKVMSKIYNEQLDTEVTGKWPQSSCALKNPSLSRKYSECCTSAQAIIGASCAAVYREEGLGPFKSAAMSMAPAVEETCKQRVKIVTDFDSYRRRLKALETKKITLEVEQACHSHSLCLVSGYGSQMLAIIVTASIKEEFLQIFQLISL
jgi:hypothetical protein